MKLKFLNSVFFHFHMSDIFATDPQVFCKCHLPTYKSDPLHKKIHIVAVVIINPSSNRQLLYMQVKLYIP